jgi:hypothetical protein
MNFSISLSFLERELDHEENQIKSLAEKRNQNTYEGVFEFYLGVTKGLKSHYNTLLRILTQPQDYHPQLNNPEETA